MVEDKFGIHGSEMPQNESIYVISLWILSSWSWMIEENFFRSSEMLQNESFLWDLIVNTFSMVEENFEIQILSSVGYKMLQNVGFS